MEGAIQYLRNLVKKGELEEHFGREVNIRKVELFEKAFGVKLPDSFKTFLGYYNGGFIANREAESLILTDEFEEAERISNRILSIEEIIEEYEHLSINRWKLKPGFEGFYPYIPFCLTADDNEKLVFVDQTLEKESAVYLALHDEPASHWECIAENFTEFLIQYINTKGELPDDGHDHLPKAEDYLVTLESDLRINEVNDPLEIVKRITSYLEIYPDDALSYNIRAIAYDDSNQYEKALKDFNKSLDLDPLNAFTYYCRGGMFLKIRKARQALTDFDSACKLKPEDPYYLTRRAEAFYELNKMDKALTDCNRAIEIDNSCELAYMTRYNIYLYLGEGQKAEADAQIIDELLKEN
jgi:tetratricopeptide (TPR) repeat protein